MPPSAAPAAHADAEEAVVFCLVSRGLGCRSSCATLQGSVMQQCLLSSNSRKARRHSDWGMPVFEKLSNDAHSVRGDNE